ncbi:MAG TPA: hypothetical protein VMD30_10675 [Tepidisphaeraceae bacterium]|nr:hypothetical protein [Tepidisphaeraceae bacterium]
MNLSTAFDRVVVVNLARRPQRMAEFWANLGSDWPFARPQRFAAIDGAEVGVPAEWKRGAGAWGCMLSHRQIMRSAIADGIDSILVLEDDAVPVRGFGGLAGHFMRRVPDDWDCLMLGGQHLTAPKPIIEGIVQCVCTHRTHAFAVRRRMMPGLLKFWETVTDDHCDIVLAACMGVFKTYAPDPFLIGQSAGFSDVTRREEQLRFLAEADRKDVAA